MSKNQLPQLPEVKPCAGIKWEPSSSALNYWNSGIRASSTQSNAINIFSYIADDYWDDSCMTATKFAAALQACHGEDVIVNINSPGGDVFEGFAIYNQMRGYSGTVTVKVLGLAASAAATVAMGGDEVQIANSGFLMIHNCWSMAFGNHNDFQQVAQTLEHFDVAMRDIYASKSGITSAEIAIMMDNETYFSGSEAIAKGFADTLLPADVLITGEETPQAAMRKIESLLAKAQVPRAERRKLLKAVSGMPGATSPDMPGAVINNESLRGLTKALDSLKATCN